MPEIPPKKKSISNGKNWPEEVTSEDLPELALAYVENSNMKVEKGIVMFF